MKAVEKASLLIVALLLSTDLGSPSVSASELPVLGDADASDLSPAMERRLGEVVMRDYRASGVVYDDREATEFLNRLGARIVAAMPNASGDFEFFLVKDNTLNAFALPGGYVGVHSGLIAAAQNESELASVLAHEIGHVTQRHIARMFGRQRQGNLLAMGAMALAVLAARSNPQASAGIAAAGTGLAAQQQLSFSRDAEREADRVGYQALLAGGFDSTAMVGFFTRLQQSTRQYENNAPVYLRTHPLTTERIADIQNRAVPPQRLPRSDNLEYQLLRAKMRVLGDESTQGLKDAVTFFEVDNQRWGFTSLAGRRYGQAIAYKGLGRWAEAASALADAQKAVGRPQPMLERFGIELRLAQILKKPAAAGRDELNTLADDALALRKKHENALSTTLLASETLQRAGRHRDAEALLEETLQIYRSDPEVYERLAESEGALGKTAEQHLHLSHSYELQGAFQAAIEQAQIARRAVRNDFYLQSQLDVRLKALQAKAAEEKAELRQ